MRNTVALLVFGLTFAGAPDLFAQRHVTLEELPRFLVPGDSIEIVQATGEVVRGQLLSLDAARINLRPVTPPRAEQRRLDLSIPLSGINVLERHRDSPRNGAILGASIGAGFVGALAVHAVAVDRNEIGEWAPYYLLYAAVFSGAGALIGWAIDAAQSKPALRYEAGSTASAPPRSGETASDRRGAIRARPSSN